MNKNEQTITHTETIAPMSEKKEVPIRPNSPEQHFDNSEEYTIRDPYQKTHEELKEIAEIRHQISMSKESAVMEKETASKNPTEIEVIDGQQYFVEYVPKDDIYPAYGYGGGKNATVRQDLPPRVKNFVKAHELYHCQDKATWGGWIGSEIRANIIPGLKDPIGLGATILNTITDVDRIKFYLKRIKGRY